MVNVRQTNISPEILGTDTTQGPVFQDKEWLDYRKKWNQYPQEFVVKNGPLQMDLFAVDICNLRCPMCPRNSFVPGSGYMDMDTIMKLLDQAGENNVPALNFGGLGEPTFHPDLIEIIRYAKKKGFTDVNMHTNGTRLTPAMNRKIIESGLDRIIISLDSADKETYEKIRVGASFEKTYAGVEDLIAQRDTLGSRRPHVKLNFIEMNEEDSAEKDLFTSYWQDKANSIAILRYLDCQQEGETLAFEKNYSQDNEFCCPELWRRMMILSDGCVTLCPRDAKKRYVVGDIKVQTISEIWNGEKMNHVRRLHREGRFKEIAMCKECPDSYYK